jgi:leucyl aminopeptidase (aminopeptidase T)
MARQEKYAVSKVVEAVQQARGLRTIAARILDCHPDTLERYIQKHPKVMVAIQLEKEKLGDLTELKLYEAISAGERWAVEFYARTQLKHRGYTENPTTAIQTNITVEVREQANTRLAAKIREMQQRRDDAHAILEANNIALPETTYTNGVSHDTDD